ncbi:hypothetical protein SCATT_50620 [Streptantibioticus cattleyicolor NRRL 8057 = DSM 46488]|uniref:Uncharacterized protein n=1 Tax=Streptantibioticus cattleyicolor (strain ATCC 35852 / DSM 46488 / JCM 4925 / NBRC 14057 / NRRL 8057) TaxID=1003195 RepID=G8X3Q9_STREN|nr:hypothetical protein SCATT_50620 [Streptantibioticus cattleyicolor NRRL 8057 = DSM 46488]
MFRPVGRHASTVAAPRAEATSGARATPASLRVTQSAVRSRRHQAVTPRDL